MRECVRAPLLLPHIRPRHLTYPLVPYTTLFRSCSPTCCASAPNGAARCAGAGTPCWKQCVTICRTGGSTHRQMVTHRSEEHTAELQSRGHLVCRLLLEKKK